MLLDCTKRILGAGFGYAFFAVHKTALGGVVANFPVDVPISDAHFIMVNNCLPFDFSSGLFFTFTPISIVPLGSNSFNIQGNEQVFLLGPISSVTPLVTNVGMNWYFDQPLPPRIYLQIAQSAGGGDYNFSLFFARKRIEARSMFAKVG
jgi:hypothetical protein